jgi:hypothetical protein
LGSLNASFFNNVDDEHAANLQTVVQ